MIPVWTCAGGTSIGVQGLGGGISIGNATPNETCDTVFVAEALASRGDHAAANEVLCELSKARAARKRAGSPCWADRPENQPKSGEPTDPFVRKRLGLPTL